MDEKAILVIDADEQFHAALQEAFVEKPARFIFSKDTSETIVTLAVDAPDFVILSLDIPDGNGLATLQNIRGFNPDVPIIATSSNVTKEQIVAAKQANTADFLLKPVDMQRLMMKVSARLWVSPELLAAKEAAADAGKPGPAKPGEKPEDAPPPPEPKPEPAFVEAIPKGAEVLHVNEILPGMKVARVVEKAGIVYIDKGVIIKDAHIKLLNRLGVSDVCVYINPELKKRAQEMKKRLLAQTRIVPSAVTVGAHAKHPAPPHGGPPGATVFSKVKRTDIRVPVSIPATARFQNAEGFQTDMEGLIVDVSAGGCAFLSKDKLEKDTEALLNFDLFKFPMKDVKAVARHCAKRGTEAMPFRTGFLFLSLTEKFKENLVTKLFQIQTEQRKEEIDKKMKRRGYRA